MGTEGERRTDDSSYFFIRLDRVMSTPDERVGTEGGGDQTAALIFFCV